MNDIWIGSKFRALGNGVLILGESTYGGDAPLDQVIPEWIRGALRDQTFSRIFNAFSGNQSSTANTAQRGEFWETVAFGNFVQQSVGPTRRHRPSRNQYSEAAKALPAILKVLNPRGVIILGIGQSEFSDPVIKELNIPCVTTPHPASRGLKTNRLIEKWGELQKVINP